MPRLGLLCCLDRDSSRERVEGNAETGARSRRLSSAFADPHGPFFALKFTYRKCFVHAQPLLSFAMKLAFPHLDYACREAPFTRSRHGPASAPKHSCRFETPSSRAAVQSDFELHSRLPCATRTPPHTSRRNRALQGQSNSATCFACKITLETPWLTNMTLAYTFLKMRYHAKRKQKGSILEI